MFYSWLTLANLGECFSFQKCRNYQPVVKCTLCRDEFTPGEKGSTNNNCRYCTKNLKVYGEPAVCRFCNLTAAFVDHKCQRCTAYEKKYGTPAPCEQCKMKCAFDRTDKNRAKVDGRLLCWLCTLAYKRVIAKARQRQEEKKQGLRPNPSSYDKLEKISKEDSNGTPASRDKISPFESNSQSSINAQPQKDSLTMLNLSVGEKSTPPSFASSFDFLREHKEEKSNDSSDVKIKQENKEESHKHRHHHHHHHHHKKHHKRSHSPRSPSKRPRLENTDSNGLPGSLTPNKTSMLATEKSPVDPNSSEHIIAINRLQEQLNNLKKQLSMKDQQLLEKEKKMTEIKASQWENEKSLRTKLTDVTRKNLESLEILQGKNRELEKKNRDLSKQVQQLSKGKKAALLSSANNSQNNSPNISS
ncbi:protein FAM76B-like [Mya arenaria]|uniref:protein FAM76B-like n=1 Tax=Mya arenaria TaxID=6604 RepID=UPI0022E84012|nr:protein FAM76B-like [Mya arenaria]